MATTVEMANETMAMWGKLDALWQSTDSAGHREQIAHEMLDLQRVIKRLMSENSKQAGQQYSAAIKSLKAANTKIQHTIDTLNKMVQAIEAAAKAIDLATKLLP